MTKAWCVQGHLLSKRDLSQLINWPYVLCQLTISKVTDFIPGHVWVQAQNRHLEVDAGALALTACVTSILTALSALTPAACLPAAAP